MFLLGPTLFGEVRPKNDEPSCRQYDGVVKWYQYRFINLNRKLDIYR